MLSGRVRSLNLHSIAWVLGPEAPINELQSRNVAQPFGTRVDWRKRMRMTGETVRFRCFIIRLLVFDRSSAIMANTAWFQRSCCSQFS